MGSYYRRTICPTQWMKGVVRIVKVRIALTFFSFSVLGDERAEYIGTLQVIKYSSCL